MSADLIAALLRLTLALPLSWALSAWPHHARAEVSLEIGPPPLGVRCPGEEAFVDEVERLLGRRPFHPRGQYRCELRYALSGRRLNLDLWWSKGEQTLGARRLSDTPERCEALTEAAAVYASTLIQTLPTPQGPPILSAPRLGAWGPHAPSLWGGPPLGITAEAERGGPWGPWVVWLGGAGAVGLVPGIGGNVELALARRAGRLSVFGGARVTLGGQRPRGVGEISSDVYGGLLGGCAHRGPLAACALTVAGLRVARGGGYEINDERRGLLGAVGGQLRGRLPLSGPWALEGVAEVLFPWTRTSLQVEGVEVWATPAVSAALGIALSRRL